MAYSLRQVAAGNVSGAGIPDWTSLSIAVLFSDVGTCTVNYALDGTYIGSLADQSEIAVYDDIGEIPDTRWVVEGSNGNIVAADEPVTRSFKGRTIWKGLAQALVYAADWNGTSGAGTGKRSFTSASPGTILVALLQKAQDRGDLAGYTWNFTASADSNGVSWGMTSNLEYEMGVSLLQVFQNMVDQGLAEFRLVGRQIRAYKSGTLGTDRTTGATPVIMWEYRNTIEVPEQTDSQNLASVVLVKGDDGVFREVVNQAALNQYGRRTMFFSQGGTSDAATLDYMGRITIDRAAGIKSERTYKYRLGSGTPTPFRDFQVGDWVLQQHRGNVEKVRVRAITVEVDADDPIGYCILTLNDQLMENDIILARKVAGITGGSSGSTSSPDSNVDGNDTLAPGKVVGVGGSTISFTDGRAVRSQINATWAALTTNADGSPMTDLGGYHLVWRFQSETAFNGAVQNIPPDRTNVVIGPLTPGSPVTYKVRAVDKAGNIGEWSDLYGITSAADTTPPPIPSTPVVTAWLGAIRVYWDGKGQNNVDMPVDTNLVEIHVGDGATFAPSATTLYEQVIGAGYVTITNRPYGAATFVRLVSVDLLGNKSNPSTAGSATAARLVEADVADAAVTTAKLADRAVGTVKIAQGAITADSAILADAAILTAKIANLAVNNAKIADATIQDAKIASLSVAKLVAGTLQADMTVSSNIQTASTGARVVLNGVGLAGYDSGNNRTVFIPTNGGNAMFKGDITARTLYSAGYETYGNRYIEFGDVQGTEANDEIRFWNQGYVTSIRNPVDAPGTMRISSQGSVFDFGSDGYIRPSLGLYWTGSGSRISALYSGQGGGGLLIKDGQQYTGNPLLIGSAENAHGWISNGVAGLMFLYSTDRIYVREGGNGGDSDFRARILYYTQSVSAFSSTRTKTNIKPLEVDVLDAIRKAKMHVWKWREQAPDHGLDDFGEAGSQDGIGLLIDELPNWLLRGDSETYELGAVVATLWQAVRELDKALTQTRVDAGLDRPNFDFTSSATMEMNGLLYAEGVAA